MPPVETPSGALYVVKVIICLQNLPLIMYKKRRYENFH